MVECAASAPQLACTRKDLVQAKKGGSVEVSKNALDAVLVELGVILKGLQCSYRLAC